MKRTERALRRAVAASGGPSKLARHLRVSPQAVIQWKTCPVLRVLAVERISGVPRHELRPDLYPPTREPAAP